jgi:hypothetical protein
MPLKDERIQDNRIRPTPEIGCRGTYPAPPASMLVRRVPSCRCSLPRSGNGGVDVTAATRVERGAEHVRLLTIHGEGGRRRMGWDRPLRHSTEFLRTLVVPRMLTSFRRSSFRRR